MKKANQQLNSLFCVEKEMIRECGEDCAYYEFQGNDFIAAAFDGLGGSGSKRYGNYSGKTGAYVASRAVCGGVKAWFDESRDSDTMKNYMQMALDVCKHYEDKEGRIMGSLGRSFPTTAAIITGNLSRSCVTVNCHWAGDSRCYLLDEYGLHQLTEDDLDGEDAMSNLTSDGVMTNMISAGMDFKLHNKEYVVGYPCVLICATDGCFGYVKSPMDFEYMLLESLLNAKNIYEWKINLYDSICDVTGDDFTLCVAACGFRDFRDIKKNFAKRANYMAQKYINSDIDPQVLWQEYKEDYSMM